MVRTENPHFISHAKQFWHSLASPSLLSLHITWVICYANLPQLAFPTSRPTEYGKHHSILALWLLGHFSNLVHWEKSTDQRVLQDAARWSDLKADAGFNSYKSHISTFAWCGWMALNASMLVLYDQKHHFLPVKSIRAAHCGSCRRTDCTALFWCKIWDELKCSAAGPYVLLYSVLLRGFS